MSDPYAVLGVPPDASEVELRAAYRQLVRAHSPDRDPLGFERVRSAYEAARDPAARARAMLDERVPLFPPPRLSEAPVPDVPQATRELMRWLLATGRLKLEDPCGR